MTKPQPQTETYYDFIPCRDYLNELHGVDMDCYEGNCNQDFWGWILERHDIHNDCTIYMHKDDVNDDEPEWVKTIYGWWIEEFGDESGEITLHVWW